MPAVTLRRIGPENAGQVPYLSMDWDEARTGIAREEYLKRLRKGKPRIELWPTRDRGICATPFVLEPGQERVVGRRLVEVFKTFV